MTDLLKQSVMSGVKWIAFTKIIIQLFRWGATFWVIRQLNPSDYGVMAIAEIVINLLTALNFLCIGNIIIRHKCISKAVMDTLFSFCLLLGVLLFAIQFLSAPYFASFYDTPEAKSVLQLLAVAYLLESFNVKPFALMAKRLEFKRLAQIDLVAGIFTPLATIIAALSGLGYWSLAIGYLVHTLVRFIMANYKCRTSFRVKWHYRKTAKLMKFGIQNSISSAVAQIGNSLDFIIGGILFATNAIGIYQVGLQIAFIPLRKISPELRRLSFPAFCKINHDLKLVTAYYKKTIRLFSFILFPVFWGLSYLSEDIIISILTDKWIESAIIIKIICWALPLKLLNEMSVTVLNALGRAELLIKNSIVSAVTLLLCIITFQFMGIQGLSLSWAISIVLTYLILLIDMKKILSLSVKSIFILHYPPILSSAVMCTSLYVLNITIQFTGLTSLLTNVVMGAIIYSLFVFVFNRSIGTEFKSLLKS
jgi:O-antigen/teichoic acid export membrane protein